MNKNINLLIEFSKEMNCEYIDEEILNCMINLLEGGMNPKDLLEVINKINNEL